MTEEQRKKLQAELTGLNKKIAALEALMDGYKRKKSQLEILLAR